jgi:hypothetical protein
MIDNGQIRHAYKKLGHNLEPDDIFHILDVINNADSQSAKADSKINFLTEQPKADCWRKKKKR